MSNNKQEIIKRIEEITEEIGLTSNSVGGSVSLRDLSEQIIQKLTSTSSSDINGKVLDIFNKIQTIYNWSSNTDTKTNQIYTWFSSIYNELNSTSTSYMKGKINSIYNNDSSNTSKINSIYNKVHSGGGAVKSVQSGSIYHSYSASIPSGGYRVDISHINPNKSVLLISDNIVKYDNSLMYRKLFSNHFVVNGRENDSSSGITLGFTWQVIEFY